MARVMIFVQCISFANEVELQNGSEFASEIAEIA